MRYSRKQLRKITGLPDKTLRYLLDKLRLDPVDIEFTLFCSPIYIYDDSTLDALHAYIFKRDIRRAEQQKGKRCRGGCNRYLPPEQLNSQQICPHCRRRKWLLNEVTEHDPLTHSVDLDIISDLQAILQELSAHQKTT